MLTREEVEHIALLARIGLTDTEVEKYRKDLSGVLDFFHELEELDLSGESEGDVVPVKENDTREDRVVEFGGIGREDILKRVPSKKDGFIRVRSVF
ncbi:MAG TPA: Asp-tRNA(Asn)/Glu-tRNA(Gln) amidotransferase subunit GatC [Candidatus Fimivivens sp.]|nr:Asp-tRNA(Asn)/Glu-tRNA(Gln) amidotransferase subunit GatC [Candidatus Fimivivens sp.]